MKKYLNTVSAFQFYQLVRYATLILIGIVFTKTALTQESIGEYETFVFLAGAVSFFWLNGLLKALLPLASQNNSKNSQIFSAFVTIQTFSIFAAILVFFLQPLFVNYLLNGQVVPEIWLLLLFIVFGVPANLVEYYYLIKKRNQSIIIYAIISFIVQLLLVILPAIFNQGIKMSMQGLVLSVLLRYIWLWIIFIRKSEIHFSGTFFKEHLNLGGPLITATLLSGSAQFIDGFIVTSKFDKETFAVFQYGARELPLAMLLANALGNAMLPEFGLKENLKKNLNKLKRSVGKLMHLLFPITAVLILISRPLFPIVFNPDFAESASIFNIYLLLVISRLLMPQTILTGLKISRPIMFASFFELVLNVALSLILVQFIGIAGVAFATFVAYLFEKIYLAVVVKGKLNINFSEYVPFRIYLLYSTGIILLFIFVEFILKF